MSWLFGILGIGGIAGLGLAAWFGFLPAIMAVVTPILRVVVGWFMDTMDFLVRRFIREVKALFDVFPFIVLLLVFVGGGLFFHGWDDVKSKSVTVIKKVTPKSSSGRRARRQPKQDFVDRLFTDPFKTLGIQ